MAKKDRQREHVQDAGVTETPPIGVAPGAEVKIVATIEPVAPVPPSAEPVVDLVPNVPVAVEPNEPGNPWDRKRRTYTVELRAGEHELSLLKDRVSAVWLLRDKPADASSTAPAPNLEVGVARNFRIRTLGGGAAPDVGEPRTRVVCDVEMCKETWTQLWKEPQPWRLSVRGYDVIGPAV